MATSKVAEVCEYARKIDRALGGRAADPTLVCTDNKSNMQVAMRQGAANRSKHLLRRYYVLLQRIRQGAIAVRYLPDRENPSDFLTKWLPAPKLNRSLHYVIGATARPSSLPPLKGVSKRTGRRARALPAS